MITDRRRGLVFAAIGAATALLVIGVGTAAAIWSGMYNIGADSPHSMLTLRVLEQVRQRALAHHAEGIPVPVLNDPAMISEGAEHYAAMCTECHMAPGVSESELRPGLYPQPPNLAQRGIEDPRVAFWAIKHGIKMSGMPAWGSTHDDAEIWNIVAFLRKLPTLSPAGYAAMQKEGSNEAAQDGDSTEP